MIFTDVDKLIYIYLYFFVKQTQKIHLIVCLAVFQNNHFHVGNFINNLKCENTICKKHSFDSCRLSDFEEKYNELKSINSDMGVKNAELQEKLVKLQERYADMEMELTCKSEKRSSPQSQAQLTNEKLEELEKKLTVLTKELDDRNKAMIKMKIEHKNKLKNVNQIVQTLKGVGRLC